MKKIYTIVFLSVFSLGLFAQESILSLSLYDLSSANLNMSHTDIKKNVIKLETIDSQNGGTSDFFYAKTSGNPLDCVGGTPTPGQSDYGYVQLEGNVFYSEAKSPTILITLPSDDNITAIEVLGYGSSAASESTISTLAIGFSEDGKEYVKGSGFNPFIKLNQTTCATTTNTKKSIAAGTRYIKLLHTSDYVGFNEINMESKPQIYAIRFHAKDILSGVEESTENSIELELYGRNLQLNASADVKIYDLTGKLVAYYRGIEEAYLDALEGGLYLITAETKEGMSITQKVMLR